MKNHGTQSLLLFLAILFFSGSSQAQISDLNVTSVSNLPYTQELNDIWGYVDGTGIEYALVGKLPFLPRTNRIFLGGFCYLKYPAIHHL